MKIRGKIPITIYPAYWIFTAILSFFLSQGSFVQIVLWMAMIFVSILLHEFGHALTALFFGCKPRIELVAMGGITYHNGSRLAFWKQLLIAFNGPLFGFTLGLIALFLRNFSLFSSPALRTILLQIGSVNIFWTIVNLLPVLPLDGGQILRIGLEKLFDFKGVRYTFLVSALFALLASMALFVTQNILAGAIFFLFAFENFANFHKSRNLRGVDNKEELKRELIKAEMLLKKGQKEEALLKFQTIRSEAKEGVLYDAATQYAALILDEQGDSEAAYELLKPLQERVDPEALLLLHRLAFERGDHDVVATIGASVFQLYPLAEVAVHNAYTAAHLKHPVDVVGWLETAKRQGALNLMEIIQESIFDPIREEPVFRQFCDEIGSKDE